MGLREGGRLTSKIVAMVLTVLLVAPSALAASVPPTQIEGADNNNKTCEYLYPGMGYTELKVEPVPDGTNTYADGMLSVKIVKPSTLAGSLNSFDWSANLYVIGVVVKDGVDGANFYDYSGAGMYGVLADTYLTTPYDGAKEISHISFCYNPNQPQYEPLVATKTAAGTYDRTVTWKLEKTVDPASHTGFAGETAGTSTWTVTATKTETFGNYKVAGKITVSNPNDIPVGFEIADTLDDGTVADVSCPVWTVPAKDYVQCTYTAMPAGKTALLNTAVVTSKDPNVAGDTATAAVMWTEKLIGYDKGLLTDPRFDFKAEIDTSTTKTFEETFKCSDDVTKYVDGVLKTTYTNWAYLDSNIGLSAMASVDVTCTLPALVAAKDAAGTYDREITWKLEKSVDPASHEGYAGLPAGDSTWTVTATKTAVENGFKVAGSIVITNPAAVPQPFMVKDVLDDGTVAAVDCPTWTVPARAGGVDGKVTCTYLAEPKDAGAKVNYVTVMFGDREVKAQADITWKQNLLGYESGKLTDPRFKFEAEITGSATKTFPETFTCPADASLYTDGKYAFAEVNWAYLNGNINLSASAKVDVICKLPALVASKDAAGTYDREITWKLDKTVDVPLHKGYAGEEAGASEWKVIATKTVVESKFTVTGSIVIDNPAAVPQTFSVTDVLGDGTVAVVMCPTNTVPALGKVTCTYTAEPKDARAEINYVAVSFGDRTVEAKAMIGWKANVIGYETGTLTDPRFDYKALISETTTVTFPEKFLCSADASAYTDGYYEYTETNWAYLNDKIDLQDSATVTVKCLLPALMVKKSAEASYDRTVTWKLTKSVDPTSLFGLAGEKAGSVLWTVEATKSEALGNYQVWGKILVHNPAAIPQTFSVVDKLDDGTLAAVVCPKLTLAAGETVECTYTAMPAGMTATMNYAIVSATGNKDVAASAEVKFIEKLIGYDKGTLSDPRFMYSELISGSTTKTFPETFTCPADTGQYVNGYYTFTEVNWAYLNDNINLKASAEVAITCYNPWKDETAVGAGKTYPGSSNWFMYTPYTAGPVDLVAGQWYDAGDITMWRAGTTTYIRIVLHEGFRWAMVKENLKIQPFDKEPTRYYEPGSFKYKFTVSGSDITVEIPNSSKAKFFGIHGDVERWVAPPPML